MTKNSLFILFFFMLNSFAQEEYLFSLTGSVYDASAQKMSNCNMEFKYNFKKDVVYLMLSEDSVYVGYLFDAQARDSLSNMLDKYLEWYKKAIEMDTEVDKEINKIHLAAYFNYKNSKTIYTNGYALLKTYFLSQDTDWHQLVFKFGRIEDRHNRFISHKTKNIYLDRIQVMELKKAFDSNYLETFKQNIKKQRSIRKLFK